jgi:hypothetical protein
MTNFSYMQPWYVPGVGFLAFFTHYNDPVIRTICFMSSPDGRKWSEWTRLGTMGDGHYQISEVWIGGGTVRAGTAFNYHPDGPNSRTNLYYMETSDRGGSWQTAAGEPLDPPLSRIESPALVHNYAAENRRVYLKDIAYDEAGRPVMLYITSRGYESGPEAGPRQWTTARWTGDRWEILPVTTSDSNYDMGSLYLEGDHWRIMAPTDTGPQPFNPGGEMVLWESEDRGRSWRRRRTMTAGSERNHTYARRPPSAHPDFYAFWADGDPRRPSISRLYYADREGRVFVLPERMDADEARPLQITPAG